MILLGSSPLRNNDGNLNGLGQLLSLAKRNGNPVALIWNSEEKKCSSLQQEFDATAECGETIVVTKKDGTRSYYKRNGQELTPLDDCVLALKKHFDDPAGTFVLHTNRPDVPVVANWCGAFRLDRLDEMGEVCPILNSAFEMLSAAPKPQSSSTVSKEASDGYCEVSTLP
ncbi:hypothetical protein [Rhizobium sp. NLR22b]|uniref:hypothetical protein n=1 Tax=Rhizobium sp. NLR22b TaxID=2731115 RepID=UPI001C82EA6E|nr:hypothetical protein [Rhizobium sp. NLR22b]MBX5242053.1 hypothetical protein [Rhizobium sp. NLR22b]